MGAATKIEKSLSESGAELASECPECLGGNLGWLLSHASFVLATELSAAFSPLGITPRGYHVLGAAMTEQRTQTELAELVGLDKTTMVVTMDELEEAGLAERHPSPTDRRARIITVTKAGERKVAQARKVIEQIQKDVLETLPARERKVFIEALGTLVERRLAAPIECSPPLRRREPH